MLCYNCCYVLIIKSVSKDGSFCVGYLALTHCRFFVLDEADGLLKAGYTELIERLHRQIPKITSDGRRLQMVVCSATLHAFEVKKMAVCIYLL